MVIPFLLRICLTRLLNLNTDQIQFNAINTGRRTNIKVNKKKKKKKRTTKKKKQLNLENN